MQAHPMTILLAIQEATEAVEEKTSGGNDFWILMIALVAVFYFVMILPEKKNRKKREEMLGELKKGDRVLTSSGMHASVAIVQDDVVTLQAADGVRLRFSRSAIQTVMTEDEPEEQAKALKS